MKTFAFKTAIIAIVMTGYSILVDSLNMGASPLGNYFWQFLSNLLICITLGIFVQKSFLNGLKLLGATFGVMYIIGVFNILIEAYIFNVTDRMETLQSLMTGIPFSALVSFLVVKYLGNLKEQKTPQFVDRSVFSWMGKVLAGNVLYFIFYISAGITLQLTLPGFNDYYGEKVPPLYLIILTNLCFRGFIFVGIAILIDYSLHSAKKEKALLTGLIFTIIGGIAPLIPPNEFMPFFIRLGHGFEVGISNFIYGYLMFLIIARKEKLPEKKRVEVAA